MDRRTLAAVFILVIVWLLYPSYLKMISPKPVDNGYSQATTDQETVDVTPALTAPEPHVSHPDLDPAIDNTTPTTTTIRTDTLSVTFTNIGGGIERLASLTHRNGKEEETVLFDAHGVKPAAFSLALPGATVDLEHVAFIGPEVSSEREVRFSYTLPSQLTIVKRYELSNNEHALRMFVELNNPTNTDIPLVFEVGSLLSAATEMVNGAEKVSSNNFETQSLACYTKAGDQIVRTAAGKLRKKGAYSEGRLDWMGLGRHYFAVLVKPENNVYFDQFRASADEATLRSAARLPPVTVPAEGSRAFSFLIYAGPTARETLKSFGADFEGILTGSGVWAFFKTVMLVMLGFFYKLTHNYGLAIIAVSVTTKLAFWPLTHMSFQSMQKMQEISPKIKALQEQHKGNPEKLNKETMELYKRHKVNPLGGCLPMILQIPVFIALYQVISEAVELRGAHFVGWITDLSEQDVLYRLPFEIPFLGSAVSLLPILMIISMVLQQKLQPQAASVSPEQQQMFKFMPIIFGFMFYKLPSGLVLYWTVSNVLAIIHQLIIRRKSSVAAA